MGVGIGLAVVVLALRGLIAQAELQPAIAGRKPGIVERALQLVGVLAQHRQRLRPFDRQMRRHLAVAIDVDADIDAAEVGRIEPDLETALAALGGCHDFHREPAQRHRGLRRRCGHVQLGCEGRCGRSRGRLLRLDRAGGLQAVVRCIDQRLAGVGGGRMTVAGRMAGDADAEVPATSALAASTMPPSAFGLPATSACGVTAGTMVPGVDAVARRWCRSCCPARLTLRVPSFATTAVLTWVAAFDAPGVLAAAEAASAMPVVTVASVDAA